MRNLLVLVILLFVITACAERNPNAINNQLRYDTVDIQVNSAFKYVGELKLFSYRDIMYGPTRSMTSSGSIVISYFIYAKTRDGVVDEIFITESTSTSGGIPFVYQGKMKTFYLDIDPSNVSGKQTFEIM